jgi:hypothetical protein
MAMKEQRANRVLRCAECGARIVRGRAPGVFTHTSRVIAGCDLDADHPAIPDRPPSLPGRPVEPAREEAPARRP